jgi:YVTN family beta-propeller protein
MENLSLKYSLDLPSSFSYDQTETTQKSVMSRKDRKQLIRLLEGEWNRIRAWNRIQKRSEDKKPPMCSDTCFAVIEVILDVLKSMNRTQVVVYVANRDSHDITVIETATNEKKATIPVGKGPCAMIMAEVDR